MDIPSEQQQIFTHPGQGSGSLPQVISDHQQTALPFENVTYTRQPDGSMHHSVYSRITAHHQPPVDRNVQLPSLNISRFTINATGRDQPEISGYRHQNYIHAGYRARFPLIADPAPEKIPTQSISVHIPQHNVYRKLPTMEHSVPNPHPPEEILQPQICLTCRQTTGQPFQPTHSAFHNTQYMQSQNIRQHNSIGFRVQPFTPIRYLGSGDQPTTQSSSAAENINGPAQTGKRQLSPKSLKKALKRKRVAPLTRKNSLKRIFSQGSMAMERIDEEGMEQSAVHESKSTKASFNQSALASKAVRRQPLSVFTPPSIFSHFYRIISL